MDWEFLVSADHGAPEEEGRDNVSLSGSNDVLPGSHLSRREREETIDDFWQQQRIVTGEDGKERGVPADLKQRNVVGEDGDERMKLYPN